MEGLLKLSFQYLLMNIHCRELVLPCSIHQSLSSLLLLPFLDPKASSYWDFQISRRKCEEWRTRQVVTKRYLLFPYPYHRFDFFLVFLFWGADFFFLGIVGLLVSPSLSYIWRICSGVGLKSVVSVAHAYSLTGRRLFWGSGSTEDLWSTISAQTKETARVNSKMKVRHWGHPTPPMCFFQMGNGNHPVFWVSRMLLLCLEFHFLALDSKVFSAFAQKRAVGIK